MDVSKPDILVVGAGPAGLMAAEAAAGSGHKVLLVDAMPSFGRCDESLALAARLACATRGTGG